MIWIPIFITLVFLLKLILDYAQERQGYATVGSVQGFIVGVTTDKTVLTLKNTATEELFKRLQTDVEISLGFITILFIWSEPFEMENEDNVY